MPAFISKYKIIQKIGEGSFSEVLKCEERETKEIFAAKILKKCFASSKDVYYCAEIIAMQKLHKHPNILYMHDYYFERTSGKLIFIFELMDMSMYDFMKTRKRCLPESRVKNYLYQILKGLDYLHRHGLFHRDIKPENILVKLPSTNQQGEIIKLADLGSIRGIYSKPPYTEYISTRWYRSPECLLTIGHYGPKMDIWATGCVFYEILTMKPLFPGTNEIDQLAKIHSVLGTPSPRLLAKLKSRSRNLRNFSKSIGTGLGPLIKNFSDEAQIIFKLMLQYDPDIRSNARRLLQHRYFAIFNKNEERDKVRKYGSRTLIRRDNGDHTVGTSDRFANKNHVLNNNSNTIKPVLAARTEIEFSPPFVKCSKENLNTFSEKYLTKTWQTTQINKLRSAYQSALIRNANNKCKIFQQDASNLNNKRRYSDNFSTHVMLKRIIPRDRSIHAPESKRMKV